MKKDVLKMEAKRILLEEEAAKKGGDTCPAAAEGNGKEDTGINGKMSDLSVGS